jgi:rare lipoprotein A
MRDRIDSPANLLCKLLAIALLVGSGFVLGGCKQAVRWNETASAPPQNTSGQKKQKSSRGNPPFYEVFDHRYYVMDSSIGFKERGVASWYGKKFHGRQTSSGAIYDMHSMTAAHKTLPLPTQVRVRNLKNGRSIIVTVNDRGPFVDNRIIDLSFAAATQLDIVSAGTALVEIEAITNQAAQRDVDMTSTIVAAQETQDKAQADISLFLQVGAFGDRANAQQLVDQLHGNDFPNAIIRSDAVRVPPIFRVRLGPITNVTEYDQLVERVATLGIVDTHLVTEAEGTSGT